MIPKFGYLASPRINLIYKGKLIKFLREFKTYFFYKFLPKKLGYIIDHTLGKYIKRYYIFVRVDCDHFGPWREIYYLMQLEKTNKKKFVILAKKNKIDKSWQEFFYFRNLIIIYNQFYQLLLSPFFFSVETALDIKGYFYLSYFLRNLNYRNYKNIPSVSQKLIQKASVKKVKCNKNNKLMKRKYVLFFARTGLWNSSINNSKRNMSLKIAKIFIKEISKEYNVFLLGEEETASKLITDNVFSFKCIEKSGLNLPMIYSNASYVIGSISGATHFPSTLFNLPTLYIGDMPLIHLNAYYNFPETIPRKDTWLFISKEELDKLSKSSISLFINKFFKNETFDNMNKLKRYKYKKTTDNKISLNKNINGNIFIYGKLNLKNNLLFNNERITIE